MDNNVTTKQNNTVHGDDSLVTLVVNNSITIDAVMDGVTDHGGAEASNIVRERLESTEPTTTQDLQTMLNDLNAEFYQIGGGRFLLTTASIAITKQSELYITAVGDSPVYLVHNNEFSQLSGRIGGLLKISTSSALGAQDSLKFQTFETTVSEGDKLLIVSDGISDNLDLNEIQTFMEESKNPEELSEVLEETSYQRTQKGGTPVSMRGRVRNDDRSIIVRFY